ncbi:MAG: MBL fold metallo-hydrolase [candidate division Zixibacteria bacterium]|jgi:L-ascorbate metabolism protein UlaG (beta-lactamase superfamily)|nr:MBL fold metallo-hydrolase [candidate division Zixibacteria bacterium]
MALKAVLSIAVVIASISWATTRVGAAQNSGTAQVIDSNTSSSIRSLLQQPLGNDEAYVWYLLHCGYAVRTGTKLLIFDYVRSTRDFPDTISVPSLATGRINPAEIGDLDVYVFVTHSHEDHFDSIILNWQKEVDRVTYIFGWQATDDTSHYHLVGPRASLQIGNMDIYTINCLSGVPEVAYLIRTDGLTIFFQGDYKTDSIADLDYLLEQCDSVDMAFLGSHTRRWGEASTRILKIMARLKPEVVFPMHYGGREQAYKEFFEECKENGLEYLIECPEKPGDMFRYPRSSAP